MLVATIIVVSLLCLAVGLTVGPFLLVWVALVGSVGGLLAIAANVLTRRRAAAAEASGPERSNPVLSDLESSGPEAPDAEVPVRGGSAEPAGGERVLASARTAVVTVLPGRRRYHTAECRLVVDRDGEQISLDEAVEEGFSACTVCEPGA